MTGQLLWEWFRLEGWVVVLACLNLLLVIRVLFWTAAMRRIVWRLEARCQGLNERLQYAVDKADRAMRRTGELSPVQPQGSDPHADTQIRARPEP